MEKDPDQVSDDDSTLEFSIEVVESSSSAESLESDSTAEEDFKCEDDDNAETPGGGGPEEQAEQHDATSDQVICNQPDQASQQDEPIVGNPQDDSEKLEFGEVKQTTEIEAAPLDLHEPIQGDLESAGNNSHQEEQIDQQDQQHDLSQEQDELIEIKHDQQEQHQQVEQNPDQLTSDIKIQDRLESRDDIFNEKPDDVNKEDEKINEINEDALPRLDGESQVLDRQSESSNIHILNDLQPLNEIDNEIIEPLGLIEKEICDVPDIVARESIIELIEQKKTESGCARSSQEQQLERQQQLIEEQLIELVDQEDEKEVDKVATKDQQETKHQESSEDDHQQNESDLTSNECDQLVEKIQDEAKIEIDQTNIEQKIDNVSTEMNTELQTDVPGLTQSSGLIIQNEVLDEPETLGDNLIQDKGCEESNETGHLESEVNEIVEAHEQGELEIPNKQQDTESKSHQDEGTLTQLGSPDIRINGGRGINNEHRDPEIDPELHKLTLTKEAHETIDHNHEDYEYSDCKTPTPHGNLFLDSNCLGYIRDRISETQQSFNCESDLEDLEAEFDNEPAFEARSVSPKRGVAPSGEYDFADELGRGKFGTVYRVKNKLSGLELAAKMISIRRQEDLKDVEREVAIMCQLQHPRLLQLYDAFVDFESDLSYGSKQICIITELIEGGELFERIIDDDFDLTEKKAAIFMRQICEGVDYMHSVGIVHLDMKPENILCVSKTSNRIKLIDFGLARKIEPGQTLRVMFGTPDFAAPEVLGYDVVSYATDMWSVGVICYVLLSGLSPFMGDSDVETMANVQRATYDFDSDAFDPITELAKDFISKLLIKDPKLRLRPKECLEHPWLEKGGRMLEVAIKSRRESIISIMSSKSDSFDISNMIGPSGICSLTSLNKRNLKKYVIRRKWHKTVNAIMALGRMGANLKQKLIGANQP